LVTLLLIAVNGLAFLWELGLGLRLPDALLWLGIVPVGYTVGEVAELFTWPEQVLPFFSSIEALSKLAFIGIFAGALERAAG
jgi:hypothetical protein